LEEQKVKFQKIKGIFKRKIVTEKEREVIPKFISKGSIEKDYICLEKCYPLDK